MANVLNKFSRLYIFNIAELISEGPIIIRKIVFRPQADTNTAVLHTCDTSAPPDCDAILAGATVGSTSIITAAGGTPFNGAATGDWLHITDCNTVADDGWYFINAWGSNTQVTVEKGINELTDGSGVVNMRIRTYSPENAMMFVADDAVAGTANVIKHEIDWGDRGRWFANLSLYSISSTTCKLDIYVA